MSSELDRYFRPAGRFMEILVGLVVLGPSGLLGYFGARGAWMLLHGSTAAPADPVAVVIGLGAALWGGYAGLRMVFGWRPDRALVPAPLLLVGGMAALLGGVVLIILVLFGGSPPPRAFEVGTVLCAVGVAASMLAWKRRRGF